MWELWLLIFFFVTVEKFSSDSQRFFFINGLSCRHYWFSSSFTFQFLFLFFCVCFIFRPDFRFTSLRKIVLHTQWNTRNFSSRNSVFAVCIFGFSPPLFAGYLFNFVQFSFLFSLNLGYFHEFVFIPFWFFLTAHFHFTCRKNVFSSLGILVFLKCRFCLICVSSTYLYDMKS